MVLNQTNFLLSTYQYYPSVPVNIVALVLYFLVTGVIACETWRYGSKYPWWIVLAGGIEVGGYISRLVGREAYDLNAFICNLVLIILAPNFLALTLYYAAGKVAVLAGCTTKLLTPRNITLAFWLADIICLGVQGAGSAIISSTLQNSGIASQSGETIVLIGLAVQLAFFACFFALTLWIWGRTHSAKAAGGPRVPRLVFFCLWSTMSLITLRNIYRVVEIAIGWAGYLNKHEVFFYCLDALPIFLALVIFALLPFGKHLGQAEAAAGVPRGAVLSKERPSLHQVQASPV